MKTVRLIPFEKLTVVLILSLPAFVSADSSRTPSETHDAFSGYVSLDGDSLELRDEKGKVVEILAFGTPVKVEPVGSENRAKVTATEGLQKGKTGYALYNRKKKNAMGVSKEEVLAERPSGPNEGVIVSATGAGIWSRNPLENGRETPLRYSQGTKVKILEAPIKDLKKSARQYVKIGGPVGQDNTYKIGWIQLHRVYANGFEKEETKEKEKEKEKEDEKNRAPEFRSDLDGDEYIVNDDLFELKAEYKVCDIGTVIFTELPCFKSRAVRYSIVSGNHENRYKIDSATGKLSFAKRLEKPHVEETTLIVKVEDQENPRLFDTAKVRFTFGWAVFVMCADQPKPGTRELFAINRQNIVKVGHVFWCVESPRETQRFLVGKSGIHKNLFEKYINRPWGYFPVGGLPSKGYEGFSWKEWKRYLKPHMGPGWFRENYAWDDGNKALKREPNNNDRYVPHDTSVHKKYDISSKERLFALLSFMKETETNPGLYHLLDNNCTTVAIRAARVTGIDDIPDTNLNESTFVTFEGNNPADMGEDLIMVGGSRGQYHPPSLEVVPRPL